MIAVCAACEQVSSLGGGGPRVLELAHDTIRLADGVSLIDVTVRRDSMGDFDPASPTATQGDVLRFISEDRGSHAIVFEGATLAPDAREFLERTGQLRSPPLITAGASWVISLDGAPAGEYRFRCATHDVPGRLTVAAR